MKKIYSIEKVSRIDSINNTLLLGIDTNAKEGGLVSHGNEIFLLNGDISLKKNRIDFFYFISFNDGYLYYEKEGEPIFYYDLITEGTRQITQNDYYFSPSQIRSNSKSCVIVNMDENFNQEFYLLSSSFEKILLSKFPKILLDDCFLYYDKCTVQKFSLSSFELKWEIEIDPEDQVERRNQGGAVFSDGENVYVRLNGGRLTCLALSEGRKLWELTNEIDQVSFSEYGDFVYVHKGHGLIEVEKSSGRIVRKLNYRDLKGLDGFSSNGIVWCFEKILVVRNSFTGDLAVFNRSTLELIHREVVDKAGIPESRDRIKFLNNYLYILSTSSRLHVYEIDPIHKIA